jgi:hydroxymethylbilane synthase
MPSDRIAMLRGNVDTRLRKLAAGEFDAIVLALAGLKRLGHESVVTEVLDEAFMLPAVGQGALGIACRAGDKKILTHLGALNHEPSRLAVTAERGLLAALEGSCKVPVAGHARIVDGQIALKGLVANLSGSTVITGEITGDTAKARDLGMALGKDLLDRGGREILAEIAGGTGTSPHGTSG